jgi:hypothetical protein
VGTWHPLAMGFLAALGFTQAEGAAPLDTEPPDVL